MISFIQIIVEDCNILPNSASSGYAHGCSGAVWANGKQSEDYCKNVGSSNGRYPWYEVCCKWENDHCVSRTPGNQIMRALLDSG